VLQTQVLDLGQVVADVQPLLRPLIGDAIRLEVRRGADLSAMLGDPSQIEQVLLNLVVNARDAMPHGGRITIETANVTLPEDHGKHPLAGGPAVMLAVTDTGSGMDAETRGRIFEPFFTTKPVGKGTGLGLATVYGIVRQSEGNITVYSEPGEGTAFRCYFPAAISPDAVGAAPGNTTPESHGAETILLVEDENELRALLRRALEAHGYAVLDAGDGVAALETARAFPGTIHLLLTDVVMPQLSGTELAATLLDERPATRVIFMSGYSDEAIERHGVLAPDSVFLQKPVSPDALSRTVREVLDERIGAEAG
jgi:two-component system, cell cycle sensor histidine kinase and response regulator CckA